MNDQARDFGVEGVWIKAECAEFGSSAGVFLQRGDDAAAHQTGKPGGVDGPPGEAGGERQQDGQGGERSQDFAQGFH